MRVTNICISFSESVIAADYLDCYNYWLDKIDLTRIDDRSILNMNDSFVLLLYQLLYFVLLYEWCHPSFIAFVLCR